MLVAIAVFVLVLYLKTKLNTDIPKLAQQVTCPSQYTIMLQNIPDTEEPELVEWVLRVFGETPFSVNWAYDVQELHTAYVQKQFLVIEVNKNKIRQRQCSEDKKAQLKETLAALTEDLARQDDILKTYESKDKVCRKVGTAFLTFEHASTAERILRDHECSFTRSLLSSLVSGFKATRLLYRNR